MIFPRCHCLVVSLSSSSHWLGKKAPSSPWRSMASTEGGRRDVGKAPEQVAAAGVTGERWQGHWVCCWQAVDSQSSGATDSRERAEKAVCGERAEQTATAGWQVPPEQAQTGNVMRVEVVACSPKLAWEDHPVMSGKRAVLQQTCGHPELTCQKAARTLQPPRGEENKEKGNVVTFYFSFIVAAAFFFPLKEQWCERSIWVSPNTLRTRSS